MNSVRSACSLAGLVAALSLSCGPVRPVCSTTTCPGCCDLRGECKVGNELSACGVRGASCAACLLGQACLTGFCGLSGAGTAGGGLATGGGSAMGGGVVGGGAVTGGGGGGLATVCNASTCGGCCDGNTCFTGRVDLACGSDGAPCRSCPGGQLCVAAGLGGACVNGGGAAGGGSAGGSIAGGTAGGAIGACNAATCPQGCCVGGACQTPPNSARCGTGGQTCTNCQSGNTCVSGSCQPCNGCVDLATGTCLVGTANDKCGQGGQFCSNCAVSSATCSNRTCVGNMSGCNASTCASGCCNPSTGTCVPRSQQTAQQCGQGAAGAVCVACPSGSCDTAAGACVSGGVDGGFPALDGGLPGLGTPCDRAAPICDAGECCGTVLGASVCLTIGSPDLASLGLGRICGRSGAACGNSCLSLGVTMVCNATTGMCQ